MANKQPQELTKIDTMLSSYQNFTQNLLEQGKDAPNEIISLAKTKKETYRRIKCEIDRDLMVINENIDKIKKKIKANTKSD